MNNPFKINKFYSVSLCVFILLAVIRWSFPSVATRSEDARRGVNAYQNVPSENAVGEREVAARPVEQAEVSAKAQEVNVEKTAGDDVEAQAGKDVQQEDVQKKEVLAKKASDVPEQKGIKWHSIGHVASYETCFPDVQDVQIVAARKWGVKPVRDREQAEQRKDELVYVGLSPYFHLDASMKSSIPYLVPRASNLLNKIGRNFYDSLYVKHLPLHKIIVSSVLRTEQDVARLMQSNENASGQSCHRFGTTFDICYTRFHLVEAPNGPDRRLVRDDTLKYVLSEVLRDLREEGKCYIKHEVRQSCFHITVR